MRGGDVPAVGAIGLQPNAKRSYAQTDNRRRTHRFFAPGSVAALGVARVDFGVDVLTLAGARAAAARFGACCLSWSVMVGNSPAFRTASTGSTGSRLFVAAAGLVAGLWFSSVATCSRALSQWTSARPSGQPSSTHRRYARSRTRSSKVSIAGSGVLTPAR